MQNMRISHRRRSDRDRQRRSGQTNLEYAILLGVLVLASLVGIVVLSQKLAGLVSYSIEVSTPDESGSSPNPSVQQGTFLPIAESDGDLILDAPSTLQDNTAIDNIDVLVDQPD